MDIMLEMVRSDGIPKDIPSFEKDFLFSAFTSPHDKSYLVEIYTTYYKDGEDLSHVDDLERAMSEGRLVPFINKWMVDKGYHKSGVRWVKWLQDKESTFIEASKIALENRTGPACYLCTKRSDSLQQCSKCKTAR